jgi:hypothetical protein
MRREKDLKIVGAASAAQKFGGLKPALQVEGMAQINILANSLVENRLDTHYNLEMLDSL